MRPKAAEVQSPAVKRLRLQLAPFCFVLTLALVGCQPSAAEDSSPAAEAKPESPEPAAVNASSEAKPTEPAKHKNTNRLAKEASPYLQQHQHTNQSLNLSSLSELSFKPVSYTHLTLPTSDLV